MDQGSWYEINPVDFELCVASIPRQAILDVGGVDEEFDKFAALSEKEMCLRIDKLGYKFYLDQSLEYRALHHERLTKDWDERYNKGLEYYAKCIHEIGEGKRLCLTNLK
jgi:GT2 family glycosyltransferase